MSTSKLPVPEYCSGTAPRTISDGQLYRLFFEYLKEAGPRRKVLVIPPDNTRAHARAGILLKAAYDYYGPALAAVLPALGTHRPMSKAEIALHFPDIPHGLFLEHNWRKDLVTLGTVSASIVEEFSDGLCSFEWPAQVNRLLVEENFDMILSLGQVVPHEVVGMANYSKNVFIGTGGREGIALSHWLGAVWGIERTLGIRDTPVRKLLDYAQTHFTANLPLVYALTVVDTASNSVQGFFAGSQRSVFEAAAAMSAKVNITELDRPAQTMVVWLDPDEYKSTWLGNKAIYRGRLAIADGGRLIILAPGIECFGEDPGIDQTIRQFGYCGTAKVRRLVDDGTLAKSLAAAAHLIHGSSEGRFTVEYGVSKIDPGEMDRVGYRGSDCAALIRRWQPDRLKPGWNQIDGQPFFFIKNPALGLWTATRT